MPGKPRKSAGSTSGGSTLGEALRAGLRAALSQGRSMREIAVETGVPQATLSTFLAGQGLTLANVEKLAAWFGMTFSEPHAP